MSFNSYHCFFINSFNSRFINILLIGFVYCPSHLKGFLFSISINFSIVFFQSQITKAASLLIAQTTFQLTTNILVSIHF